jgi:hypothetical protein
MATAGSAGIFAGMLGDEAAKEVFTGPEPAVTAGMLAHVGTARRASEGYLIEGRYKFASGTGHATWMGGGARIQDAGDSPGDQRLKAGGSPNRGRRLATWAPSTSVKP